MGMDDSSSEKSIISLGAWLQSPAGNYVRDWEQARLEELTADIFGFNATQIGLPQIETLRGSRMPHTWLTDTNLPADGHDNEKRPLVVIQEFEELPFETASIDLVLLPHVLEFAEEPHQVLREVERVLIPEGQVIICGFNPWSLWGARQALGRMIDAHFLPEEGEFIGLPRMRDWLKLLNMEVGNGIFGCYAPPFESEQWLKRCAFMESAGANGWPVFGAVYIVQAIKRIKAMRLIGPAWKTKKAPAAAGVPATNKIHRQRVR
ncbi:hypothetical protein GCM10007205_27800 [Oxalicibacterium flavum]|uniref:Methyltransferase type 11 domain-containing protein n=2 Tax=Oxalicibacterium flavum TaxID=179467 RepID=A0A8J2XZZ2_9BURK|nr:hypothetical protein GCM10007205_27800 [Oxalicibacterium flavum]